MELAVSLQTTGVWFDYPEECFSSNEVQFKKTTETSCPLAENLNEAYTPFQVQPSVVLDSQLTLFSQNHSPH